MEGNQEPDDSNTKAKHRRAAAYAVEFGEQEIETFRVAYESTKNPVYVWRAIRTMKLFALISQDDVNDVELARKATTPPPWCMDYLFMCADAVERLKWGANARGRDLPELTSDAQKTDILPAVFGFVRPGWNAFGQYTAVYMLRWVERYYWELRGEGVSYTEALAKTAERYGYEDVRSLRRQLAKRDAIFSGKTLPTRRKKRPNQ
jgi:hypothetical protein